MFATGSGFPSAAPARCSVSTARLSVTLHAVGTIKPMVADIIELARQYDRCGYRWIAALLRDAGWQVNDKGGKRLRRLEGLKVPARQPKRGPLWLNDGSCIRLRAERPSPQHS